MSYDPAVESCQGADRTLGLRWRWPSMSRTNITTPIRNADRAAQPVVNTGTLHQ